MAVPARIASAAACGRTLTREAVLARTAKTSGGRQPRSAAVRASSAESAPDYTVLSRSFTMRVP